MATNKTIPSNATQFLAVDPAEFGQGADGKNIVLTVYDGGISKHWFWGNLAFDLAGFSKAKSKIPILLSHDSGQRIGFSTDFSIDGKVIVAGRMLEGNLHADSIRNDAGQGFPFEASMGLDINRCKYTDIPEGQTFEVNGKTLKGPGTVFQKTVVNEVSVTPFGALGNTKTETYASKTDDEDPKMELTIDKMKADHADLYSQVFELGRAEADKSGRDALSAIRKVCPDAELAISAWENKLSPEQAQITFLQKENGDLKAKAEFAAKNPPAAAAVKPAVDPARQEFLDGKPTVNLAKDAKPDFAAMSDDQFKAVHADLAAKDTKVWAGFMSAEDYVAFKMAERGGLVVESRKVG